jgi:hypothetical protein
MPKPKSKRLAVKRPTKEETKASKRQKPSEELSDDQLETVTGGVSLLQACATGEHFSATVARPVEVDGKVVATLYNGGSSTMTNQAGAKVGDLHTERGYYPTDDGSLGVVGRYFEGEQTSEVGLKAGARRDIWAVISPDTDPLKNVISQGDKVFANAKNLPPRMGAALLGQAITGIVDRYKQNPPPAQFRFIVSPLVTWIWLGALVILFGGVTALWPPPGGATRRVRAAYLARVGRESAATTQ